MNERLCGWMRRTRGREEESCPSPNWSINSSLWSLKLLVVSSWSCLVTELVCEICSGPLQLWVGIPSAQASHWGQRGQSGSFRRTDGHWMLCPPDIPHSQPHSHTNRKITSCTRMPHDRKTFTWRSDIYGTESELSSDRLHSNSSRLDWLSPTCSSPLQKNLNSSLFKAHWNDMSLWTWHTLNDVSCLLKHREVKLD